MYLVNKCQFLILGPGAVVNLDNYSNGGYSSATFIYRYPYLPYLPLSVYLVSIYRRLKIQIKLGTCFFLTVDPRLMPFDLFTHQMHKLWGTAVGNAFP